MSVPLPLTDPPFTTGARARIVRDLQSLLVRWGYEPGALDGVVGPQTQRAVEAAFLTLAGSPSEQAREITAPGPAPYSSVGALVAALRTAFQANELAIAGSAYGAGPRAEEAAPPSTVSMDPREAARVESRLTGGLGWSWWQYGLAALGVVGAGYGVYRLATARRR